MTTTVQESKDVVLPEKWEELCGIRITFDPLI